LRDRLVPVRPRRVDGEIMVPEAPGLGVEPDPEALLRYTVA
jgi:L-alanine-DL-glutamate epimerase-like enolase superfamily enzyme